MNRSALIVELAQRKMKVQQEIEKESDSKPKPNRKLSIKALANLPRNEIKGKQKVARWLE